MDALIAMERDKCFYPNGPHQAEVHSNEVEAWIERGWRIASREGHPWNPENLNTHEEASKGNLGSEGQGQEELVKKRGGRDNKAVESPRENKK